MSTESYKTNHMIYKSDVDYSTSNSKQHVNNSTLNVVTYINVMSYYWRFIRTCSPYTYIYVLRMGKLYKKIKIKKKKEKRVEICGY